MGKGVIDTIPEREYENYINLTQKEFKLKMEEKGYKPERKTKGVFYFGIELKQDFVSERLHTDESMYGNVGKNPKFPIENAIEKLGVEPYMTLHDSSTDSGNKEKSNVIDKPESTNTSTANENNNYVTEMEEFRNKVFSTSEHLKAQEENVKENNPAQGDQDNTQENKPGYYCDHMLIRKVCPQCSKAV